MLPVTSINKLPDAPANMISLTICSCKSACNSNRCRCKKYLNCSDACRCLNCKNVAETKHSYEQVADKDSDDIWSLFWKIQAWKLEFWMTCFILGVNFYSILITFHNLFLNFHVDLSACFLSSLMKPISLFFFSGGVGWWWQVWRFDLSFKKGKKGF